MNIFLEKLVSISVAYGVGQGPTSGGQAPLLRNPLGEGTTIMTLLTRIIGFLYFIAVPIVTIMVLVGAFQILTAGGDPEKFKTGKRTIIYAVVGFAILLVSSGLAILIENVLKGTA